MTDLTPLARDEQECIQKLLNGLAMATDAARQLAYEYRIDQAEGWLKYAEQIDAGRKIAAALVQMRDAKLQQAFKEMREKNRPKPRLIKPGDFK